LVNVGFIGAGTVGNALAILMSRKCYNVTCVASRTPASAEKLAKSVPGCAALSAQQVADRADLVFITTPDGAIGTVAAQLKWHGGQSVVHCSGADSTAVLEPARQAGAAVGGFHPLQTFAGVEQAIENIPGSTFAIEAESPLAETLQELAARLGGEWISLKAGDKVAYHAAAVFASNYLVTLVKMAADLWKTFSVPTDQATRALMPLIRGTLHNIETIGIPDCLTGPIARGDTGTVNKHLATLGEKTPSILSAYRELGRQTVPISLDKGKIDKEQAAGLLAALDSDA
jgi:predicted short-subunit dehydrogenase-like oxidoreductase (DUF2520 family)